MVGWNEEPIKRGNGYVMDISEVPMANGRGVSDSDIDSLLKSKNSGVKKLKGDGDFRSDECIEYMKQADVVITNPPFSLFREYVAQLIEYEKNFLIIGNVNAITYKEIFPLIKDNKMWLGASIHSGDRKFYVPDDYPLKASGCGEDENGRKFIRVKGVRWFTNLDYTKRHEELVLYKNTMVMKKNILNMITMMQSMLTKQRIYHVIILNIWLCQLHIPISITQTNLKLLTQMT